MGQHGWSIPELTMFLTMLFGAGIALKVLTAVRKILTVIEGVGFPEPATGLFKRVDELEDTIQTHEDAFVSLGFERRYGERRRPHVQHPLGPLERQP